MKNKFAYFYLVLIVASLLLPFGNAFAQAQCKEGEYKNSAGNCTATTYTLLAPLPCKDGQTGCEKGVFKEFDSSAEGALGKYLNLTIDIFIGLAAVLAVIMIVLGGIEYMTSELVSGKENAKSRMTGAIFGLIIALGAYALLYTINPNLLSTKLNIDTASVSIKIEATETEQGCTNNNCAGYTKGENWATKAGAQTPLPPYVTVNHDGADCSSVGDLGCTSTRGLDMTAVIATQWGCGCQLEITGGTESWAHNEGTSHKPNSSTVDLAMSETLNSYIIKQGTPAVDAQGHTIYVIGNVKYLPEKTGQTGATTGTHWHVYQ